MRVKIPAPPFHVDWCDASYDTETREFQLFPRYGSGNPRVFSLHELMSVQQDYNSYTSDVRMEVSWLLQNCCEEVIMPSTTESTTKSAKLLLL